MILADILETLENIETAIVLMKILIFIVIAGVTGIILYFTIRASCRYQARQNAKEFDYDYLAERTAEEVCKRLMLIERQKETAYKGATNNPGDQSQGDRDGAPEQDESRQE